MKEGSVGAKGKRVSEFVVWSGTSGVWSPTLWTISNVRIEEKGAQNQSVLIKDVTDLQFQGRKGAFGWGKKGTMVIATSDASCPKLVISGSKVYNGYKKLRELVPAPNSHIHAEQPISI